MKKNNFLFVLHKDSVWIFVLQKDFCISVQKDYIFLLKFNYFINCFVVLFQDY